MSRCDCEHSIECDLPEVEIGADDCCCEHSVECPEAHTACAPGGVDCPSPYFHSMLLDLAFDAEFQRRQALSDRIKCHDMEHHEEGTT